MGAMLPNGSFKVVKDLLRMKRLSEDSHSVLQVNHLKRACQIMRILNGLFHRKDMRFQKPRIEWRKALLPSIEGDAREQTQVQVGLATLFTIGVLALIRKDLILRVQLQLTAVIQDVS